LSSDVLVVSAPRAPRPRLAPGAETRRKLGTGLGVGLATLYLSVLVLIPLAAVVWRSREDGWSAFWADVTTPEAWSTIKLTVLSSLGVAAMNAVMGTLIAWVLVRDRFRGQAIVDVLIDLPFALPTIVAGLVLIALYGPQSPINVSFAYTRPGIVVALLFVTLPFVVRTVQPVIHELDTEMEEAAASLGANRATVFRRIVLPNLIPAILAGAALSFARAISEYGSTVLISGNIPFKTQVASVHIYNQIENDNTSGAAAVATVLLVIALVVLSGIKVVEHWAVRRD
jgi:sulfate transport system permease protein